MEVLKFKIHEMEYGSKEQALYKYLMGQKLDDYYGPVPMMEFDAFGAGDMGMVMEMEMPMAEAEWADAGARAMPDMMEKGAMPSPPPPPQRNARGQ